MIHYDNEIKENEMSDVCVAPGKEEKCLQVFGGKLKKQCMGE